MFDGSLLSILISLITHIRILFFHSFCSSQKILIYCLNLSKLDIHNLPSLLNYLEHSGWRYQNVVFLYISIRFVDQIIVCNIQGHPPWIGKAPVRKGEAPYRYRASKPILIGKIYGCRYV